MPYWVYIIQSQSTSRYYCGYSDNVERRVNQHNDPEYRGSRTTKVFQGPWNIIWTKECPNRSEAVALERKIKKRGISRYLNDRSAESAGGGLTTGSAVSACGGLGSQALTAVRTPSVLTAFLFSSTAKITSGFATISTLGKLITTFSINSNYG